MNKEKIYKRQDFLLWLVGMVFGLAIIGAMMGVGASRGWDAWSGYAHNETKTTRERFLPEPDVQEPGIRGRSGPDAAGRWYYWKLPPQKANVYTRLFAWFCYASHQILIWVVIYRTQLQKVMEPMGIPKYTMKIDTFNLVSLGLNAFFHILHLINTHTTYDALAQDVTIASSQGSVILLMHWALFMEYIDRGLVFRWPMKENTNICSQKIRLNSTPLHLLRKYHGYAFAWAAIYTFWYHPMENTIGHALGFFYTWILMLQGSLMYTKFHTNVYWKLFLEIYVIIHGTLVAWQTGGDLRTNTKLWPMFFFGFGLVFVTTQIFSLPFWKIIPAWTRIIPLLPVIGLIIWCYSWIKDDNGRPWVRMHEIIRIPSAYYIFGLITWLLLYIFLKVEKKIRGEEANDPAKTAVGRILYLCAALFMFSICVIVSIVIEQADAKLPFLALMFMLQGIFVLLGCVALMFLKQSVPKKQVNHLDRDKIVTDKLGDNGMAVIHDTTHSQMKFSYNNQAFELEQTSKVGKADVPVTPL